MGPVFNSAVAHYAGRFAPSPTGSLHFGSLVSALASFLQARFSRGQWIVRIEDIDPPREVAGSADSILHDLEIMGLSHDGPVLYQSRRTRHYHAAVEKLIDQGDAYWCGCSRKDLPTSGIYAGTCRNGLPPGKPARAVRLKVSREEIRFTDRIQGERSENLDETVGDFVILRADGLPAYQLAVVVDDAFQGVTEVVRGMDLFSSTARQIFLQQRLGLITPDYAHHPLATHDDGKKLGKRFGSVPVSRADARDALSLALKFLGHSPPDGLSQRGIMDWALENWSLAAVPAVPELESPRRFQPD